MTFCKGVVFMTEYQIMVLIIMIMQLVLEALRCRKD